MSKEFYISDDKLYCLTDGKATEVTEHDREFIDGLLSDIENFYPEAYKTLQDVYTKSSTNLPYYRFLMVRRFLKCNFGSLDTTEHDMDDDRIFHFERVSCPMRGECKHECVICMPKFNSKLSDAEMRVMRMYYEYKDIMKIAEMLYLSGHTVKNHIKSAFAKIGVHSRGEFITYASRHHIFG